MVESENASSEITLHYAVTRKQIADYYWVLWKRRLWIFHVVFIAAMALFWWTETLLGQGGAYFYPIFGVVGIVIMLAYPQLRYKPQTRELIVNPEGLRTTIGKKSGSYPWKRIGRIDVLNNQILIFDRTMNAFIIPDSAFTSDDERATILAQMRDWHAKAS